jgi:hypothetical protein
MCTQAQKDKMHCSALAGSTADGSSAYDSIAATKNADELMTYVANRYILHPGNFGVNDFPGALPVAGWCGDRTGFQNRALTERHQWHKF